MMECDLCGQKPEQTTWLELYVSGSEGCSVCLTCRIALTEYANRIKQVANSVRLEERKKQEVAKRVCHDVEEYYKDDGGGE